MDPFIHPAHKRKRRRERLKGAIGATLALIVVALVIVSVLGRSGLLDLPNGGGSAADTSGGPPPPSSPFEGTPAADFGEFGDLEFPKAKATKSFGKDAVADAIEDVRSMLKAGRVDWPSKPQKPSAFAKRFAPSQRADLIEILGGADRLAYVSELLEGRSLVGEPRVDGHISVKEKVTANTVRVLEIRTNLVWAYPFDGPLHVPGDGLLIVNTQQVWQFALASQVRDEDLGLWPHDTGYWLSNIECGPAEDGFLSAFRYDPAQSGDAGSGTAIDPDAAIDPDFDQ
ncbi:MAG TPA: hypothetical protein VGF17_03975 [Phytomonospora sp.]